MNTGGVSQETPTATQIRRWRRYLAEERAEAAVYRTLAARATGQEREILLALGAAEKRHEDYWVARLGEHVGMPAKASWRTRALAFLARRFGTVFVLALIQSNETHPEYEQDSDVDAHITADEKLHGEVVRALAQAGRSSMAGSFRAAVFGANDGLVSNLALVMGMAATGVSPQLVLITGIAGLLAGAFSMAAGEYVSVRSQIDLVAASTPASGDNIVPRLDVNANELELVYRARGMSEVEAKERAEKTLRGVAAAYDEGTTPVDITELGTAWRASISSFLFFATGALIPVLPYIFGMAGLGAAALSLALVGLALLFTGGVVGILSGTAPLRRALIQLAVGYGAATVTYLLGLAFGTALS